MNMDLRTKLQELPAPEPRAELRQRMDRARNRDVASPL